MKEFILTKQESERTVLVGIITQTQNETKANEYLDELAFLAETAGAEPVKKFLQRLEYPNPVTFVGAGKLQEIKDYVEENEIGLVIFDDDLSPKQLKNIEKELQVKILDRTSLILDIFAKRAQTANAKSQVELAQYQYLLPRLTRLWTHFGRPTSRHHPKDAGTRKAEGGLSSALRFPHSSFRISAYSPTRAVRRVRPKAPRRPSHPDTACG